MAMFVISLLALASAVRRCKGKQGDDQQAIFMAMFVLSFLALASAHSAAAQHAGAKSALRASPIAHKEQFKRKLVACNTFPDDEPVSITQNRKHKLESALGYKECKAINGMIEEGDQLVFESKSAGSGTSTRKCRPSSPSRSRRPRRMRSSP